MDGYCPTDSDAAAVATLERPASRVCLRPASGLGLRRLAGRCDKALVGILALAALLWVPLLPRSTDNPQHLAAFINDEPVITLQLVGMTVTPYGNPANYLKEPTRVPKYWGHLSYSNYIYYGGTYLDAAFLLFAPLKWLGCADFPAAPLALRAVSLFAGLASLALIYLLAKQLGGPWAGLAAGCLLLTDTSFAYYCTIIHPDTTMLALALVALWAAIAHGASGSWRSLFVVGVLAGLVHGAKMGGPWMVPMASLALVWGAKNGGLLNRDRRWARLAVRFVVLGTSAAAAFFVSTPYALLDSYYFHMVKSNVGFFVQSPWTQADPGAWWSTLATYLGAPLVLGVVAVLALTIFQIFRRDKPVALILASVLGLSVVTWYSLFIRLWVCVPYLLTALAVVYLLVGVGAGQLIGWLRIHGTWPRRIGTGLGLGLAAVIFFFAGAPTLMYSLFELQRDQAAGAAIGGWAAAHLPHESKILFDDAVYFDPAIFPNARLHNGLLTYGALEAQRPDYFVLSASIYEAPHYQELRKTQKFSRGREGDFSVLLYQDLLDRGGIPKADIVQALTPTPLPAGAWNDVVRLAWSALGRHDLILGQEVRLYRYHRVTR